MEANLTKSLTDLIDDTLQELEELRKSRFAAAEIKIEGPGDGIADKPSNGDLDAKKADEDDKDEDDKEDDKEEAKKADKDEESEKEEESEEAEKAEDCKKEEDDEDDKEDDEKHPKKKKTAEAAKDILDMHKDEMKKSLETTEAFFKSHVEERVKPLEDKLATILDLVNKIAEQPVTPKGVTTKTAPLLKSEGAFEGGNEPLSKAELASKLFDLKKSGTRVDSLDITKAEMGQDLVNIMKKYEIS